VRIRKRATTAIVAAVSAIAMPLLTAASASATSGPPWEPDPNALGTLTFYNSSGDVVTGGSDLTHLFDYAEADTTDPDTGSKATLEFANPTPGEDPGNWPVGIASTSTVTPPTSAPPPLNTDPNPVATSGAAGANVSTFASGHDENTQSGYVNVYQVRVSTSGGSGNGGTAGFGQYWDADVQINPDAGTWEEIYPTEGSSAVSTTTGLAATPTASASQGQSVTLTATVAAADSSNPSGSVEFFQDGQSLGSSNVDTGTEPATLTTSALLPSAPNGTTLTATFTPSNTSSYSPSTSSDVTYTVNPTAKKPSISGPGRVGTTETCSEGTLDFGVKATYSWLASGKAVGSGSKLVIPASAYNKSLTCVASVKDGSGPTNSATSNAVKVGKGTALKATKKPTLSGADKVGKTEKVNHGTWSPAASKYTYQWLLNGKSIKHATKSSYKLTKADKNKKISCKVTAEKTGYNNGTATTTSLKVKS